MSLCTTILHLDFYYYFILIYYILSGLSWWTEPEYSWVLCSSGLCYGTEWIPRTEKYQWGEFREAIKIKKTAKRVKMVLFTLYEVIKCYSETPSHSCFFIICKWWKFNNFSDLPSPNDTVFILSAYFLFWLLPLESLHKVWWYFIIQFLIKKNLPGVCVLTSHIEVKIYLNS